MNAFDFQSRTQVVFVNGAIEGLGDRARDLGMHRSLLVSDRGLVECGHVELATTFLTNAGIEVIPYHDFDINPDTRMVEAGCAFAAPLKIDSIIGLGGGSSMDCAKGINFLLTNGGRMQDYVGYGKASQPMLPMIAVPTTAGTGSEVQSYALISDAKTHKKLACGDPKAAFQVAILDPGLTTSQPTHVTATAGFDAIAHAVETYVCTSRNPISELYSREAWRLLDGNYERVLDHPDDIEARGAMQVGAYFAGVAIEHSMLGAAHACANPLTRNYGFEHGIALGLVLPSVVRWNATVAEDRYAELLTLSKRKYDEGNASNVLADRLEEFKTVGYLPKNLSEDVVPLGDLPILAKDASEQWTASHNPRPVDAAGAMEIYRAAYQR